MFEEGSSNLVATRERLADENVQLERLGVDIANINTTFVGEEDRVTLALRRDADIIFCVWRVREERLDNEVGECASDRFNLMDKITYEFSMSERLEQSNINVTCRCASERCEDRHWTAPTGLCSNSSTKL